MIGQVAVNALTVGCSAALLALALGLVRRTSGFFDFSLAGMFTLAAYSAYGTLAIGLTPVLAIGIALGLPVLAALLVHGIIYEPLRRSGATAEVLLIASLSLLLIIQNAVSLLFGDAILSPSGIAVRRDTVQVLAAHITKVETVIVAVSVLATAALLTALRHTVLGLQMRAIANDRELSRIYGVRAGPVMMATVVIASALASVVGILTGLDTDLTPTMGFKAVLLAAVAAVVGGYQNIGGIFLGALLVATAQQVAALSLPVQWQDTIVFSCLIGFVIWRPSGILGGARDRGRG